MCDKCEMIYVVKQERYFKATVPQTNELKNTINESTDYI